MDLRWDKMIPGGTVTSATLSRAVFGAMTAVLLAASLAAMTPPAVAATAQTAKPVARISEADAARIKYTKQRFAYLDIGESTTFPTADGRVHRIRLVSARAEKDSVIGLVRRADVRLEVDGKPLDLVCAPYARPTELDGLRIQADTTSDWLDMGKRVQLSLWDANGPIVDTDLFGFPLVRYRLFSQGTQCYNEPVYLGNGDGDPKGQRFYHNYGFDLAGFEGRDEIISPIDGTVIDVKPEDGWVGIEDDRGIVIDCGHMALIRPEIKPGLAVKRGRPLGLIGRKGPSGNYSHLHMGLYLSRADYQADRACRNLNLYPWILAAYINATGSRLLAVARPHHTARTGEKVVFDGTNSVALSGKIVAYHWEFPDGTTADGPTAVKTFGRPGAYSVVLRIENDHGMRDLDVCRVRVYSADKPEDFLPTLYFSSTPSLGVRRGETVHLRGWPEGGDPGAIRLDFGDGAVLDPYVPYADVEHRYEKPGTYIITATAGPPTRPAITKLKIVIH